MFVMRHATVWVLAAAIMATLAGCGDEASESSGTDRPSDAPSASAQPAEPMPSAPVDLNAVVDFDGRGTIVAIQQLYAGALSAHGASAPGTITAPGVAGKALVTAMGVYAFIETPANEKALADAAPGQAVHITGKLHEGGRLLHVETLEHADAVDIDLAKYEQAAGEAKTLTGHNKCQCGIKIAELHTNCQLGHLHHLQADDGRLYHYLQSGDGSGLFRGQNSHFKPVRVDAIVLPGQWVLVRDWSTAG